MPITIEFWDSNFIKIVLSLLLLFGLFVVLRIIKAALNRKVTKRILKRQEEALVMKTSRVGALVGFGLGLLVIWGINIANMWVVITSMIGIVAIGFVAVWSILSNIVAGLILLTSKHVRIGDEITIDPEKAKGTVKDVGTMFTVLEKKNGDSIMVPNNLIFQRMVTVARPKARKE